MTQFKTRNFTFFAPRTVIFSEKFSTPHAKGRADAQRDTPTEARRPVTIHNATPSNGARATRSIAARRLGRSSAGGRTHEMQPIRWFLFCRIIGSELLRVVSQSVISESGETKIRRAAVRLCRLSLLNSVSIICKLDFNNAAESFGYPVFHRREIRCPSERSAGLNALFTRSAWADRAFIVKCLCEYFYHCGGCFRWFVWGSCCRVRTR